MKYLIIICLLFVIRAFPQNLLIKNATLLTVTNGVMEESDLLILNGKISATGKNLSAGADVKIIDASGKFVMPGIIDAHSHMGVAGTVNEWTNPITPEVKIADVIRPDDIFLYRALAGGVTTINTMHGSANVIGGENATIKLRYGKSADEMIFEGAPRTIKFALGENPVRVHGRGVNIRPASRMGVEQIIRTAFNDAEKYRAMRAEYLTDTTGLKLPVKKDVRLETLIDVLDGKVLIHCHSYRADEILMLLNVLKEFNIKNVTFQHVLEGYKVAKELAEFGAMASTFSDWWAYKFEVYYATPYNASIMNDHGVIVSINSDSPELVRHLYLEAAKTIKSGGTSEEDALKMITINPAKQLGIEERVGSLEAGKDADVAIFSHHPLSSLTKCEMTIIDGIIYFDINEDKGDMRLNINPFAPVTFGGEETIIDHCLSGIDEE
jgi:imidazolonepropionase-like amidohydrolase